MKRIRLASIVFAVAAFAVGVLATSASAEPTEPIFGLTSQYGGDGSGGRQVRTPSGLDTDSSGNLWIADPENARVVELSPEGKWLQQITGSGEHKLVYPWD